MLKKSGCSKELGFLGKRGDSRYFGKPYGGKGSDQVQVGKKTWMIRRLGKFQAKEYLMDKF